MSHYAVGVITRNRPDEEDITEALAKYDENISVDYYIRYTKAELIKHERDYIESIRTGRYAEYLKDPEAYAENCNPDHLKFISEEFPKRLKWNDDEVFQEALKGYVPEEKADKERGDSYYDKDGNVWSTYNPDSKWDWWEVGGRWSGDLPIRKDAEDNPDIFDSARICDIDWGVDVNLNKMSKKYAAYKESYEKGCAGDGWYKAEYFMKRYPTLEDYIREQEQFTVYAVVDADGVWHEPGQMGWFGCSTANEDEEAEWYKTFYDKFIKGHDDWWFTVVDCHI